MYVYTNENNEHIQTQTQFSMFLGAFLCKGKMFTIIYLNLGQGAIYFLFHLLFEKNVSFSFYYCA